MKRSGRMATLGVLLVMAGVSMALLAFCQTSRSDGFSFQPVRCTMGYSTGKEVFDGACSTKTTFLDCVACCNYYGAGLPQNEKEICIDLCIDKWHAAGTVYDELQKAGELVRSRDFSDVLAMGRAKTLLRRAQESTKFPRVATVARMIAKEVGA